MLDNPSLGFLDGLTPNQLQAANKDGPVLVLAGALVQILDWLLSRYVRIAFHAASTAVQMAGADLV